MSRVRSVRAWGPDTSPTACALAGRRCSLWGRRKGVPGGGAFHHCEWGLRSGTVPPLTARPLGGLWGHATHVLWARVCGCGGPTLSPWPACPVGGSCCRGGGGPFLGGVACHRCEGRLVSGAVPPPWPPVLWSGQPGIRDPSVPGAVSAGVGTKHRPHNVRPCGPALLAVGVAEGRPRGGCFTPSCEGRPRSGAVPPPTARPLGGLLGSATHVLWARVCGRGGPTLSPWPACPVGAACCGAGGGPSLGGLACHRCEGCLVSGAVPPPAARPLERAARAPRPVCPGCGRCGRGDPAPAPQRAPLRASVARCGVGGRASPGEVPATVVRGVWCQALSLPRPPVLWTGQPGFRDPVSRMRSVRAWGSSTSPTACALAGRRCSLWRWWKGVPGGGVFHHCEGRLRSGAVPPPTARQLGGLLGSATHVL